METDTPRKRQGLLTHSAESGERRRRFLALRELRAKPASDGAQLKYFLFHSRAGMACIFAFGVVFFYSGIGG